MEHFRFYPWSNDEDSFISKAKEAGIPLDSTSRSVEPFARANAQWLPVQAVSEKDVRTILKHRRRRDEFFGGELFADPAWDILLEMYAAELGQLRVSTKNVCIGASVPATTALRWIKGMEAKNLIEREGDPLDGRRQYLSLSATALDALTDYFNTIPAETQLI